jgi:hypothetical protein
MNTMNTQASRDRGIEGEIRRFAEILKIELLLALRSSLALH